MALIPWRSRKPDPEEVVRTHAPQVQRDLRRIFGPRVEIEDVCQNVFLEVLRSLPSFEGRSKVSTWIKRITWNVAYQEMRLRYRRPVAETFDETKADHGPFNPEGDAETAVAVGEMRGRLYSILEELEPKSRLAVVLHDLHGRTLREISEALGVPLQTVASRLKAGRTEVTSRMRRALNAPDGAAKEVVER